MICGMRCGNFVGCPHPTAIFVQIDPDDTEERILSWTPRRTSGMVYRVIVDQEQWASTTDTEADEFPQDAREHIEVLEVPSRNEDEDLTNVLNSPLDTIRHTWSEVTGAARYELYHSLTSGSFTDDPIVELEAGESTYSYDHEDLADDTHYSMLRALDDAGNTIDSDETNNTISAAPEPPANIILTVSAA